MEGNFGLIEMVKIYLAHPGQPSVIKRAKKFQRRLEQMGFEVINPFDQNEYARKLTEQWRKGKQDYEQASLIFSNDLDSVNKSDMVVAYFPNVWSCGTPMEIFHAFTQGKEVYVYSKMISPWLMIPSEGKVFNNLTNLLKELKKIA